MSLLDDFVKVRDDALTKAKSEGVAIAAMAIHNLAKDAIAKSPVAHPEMWFGDAPYRTIYTGLFKNNWQVGINSAPDESIYYSDETGMKATESIFETLKTVSVNHTNGFTCYLVNNAPMQKPIDDSNKIKYPSIIDSRTGIESTTLSENQSYAEAIEYGISPFDRETWAYVMPFGGAPPNAVLGRAVLNFEKHLTSAKKGGLRHTSTIGSTGGESVIFDKG